MIHKITTVTDSPSTKLLLADCSKRIARRQGQQSRISLYRNSRIRIIADPNISWFLLPKLMSS